MKKKLIMTAAVAVAVIGFSATVQALPLVTGGISLAGNVTVNNSDAADATAVTAFNNVIATGESGSFVGITPLFTVNSVTINTFTISPFTSVLPLWFVTANTSDYFNLTALTSVNRATDDAITLAGYGTVNLVGYAPTLATWTFSVTSSGDQTFSFASSNVALPDGGATAMLLGGALSALGLLRKKLSV
jgi:hypothetical protein